MWIWLIAFSFSFDGKLQLSGFVLTTMKVWHGDGSSFTDAFFFSDTMSESACEPIHSTNETSSQMTQWENGSASLNLIKKAVVVLTRLPDYKISALRPPTPQQSYSEAEFSSSSGSDMQWQPEDDSTDSNFRFRTIIRNLTRTAAVTQGNPPTAVVRPQTLPLESCSQNSQITLKFHFLLLPSKK